MLKSKTEGFIRLQTEVVKNKLLLNISDVMLDKPSILLLKREEQIAAIMPHDEFEYLESIRYDIKYGQFQLDKEYYYNDDKVSTQNININELAANFEQILAEMRSNYQIFAVMLPMSACKNNQRNSCLGIILIGMNNLWKPDY